MNKALQTWVSIVGKWLEVPDGEFHPKYIHNGQVTCPQGESIGEPRQIWISGLIHRKAGAHHHHQGK
jgi:hypothetical protein